MSFLIFIMPPDSRMFHSKYFFSVWFGRFFGGVGDERAWRGELICDKWECLDLSAQDSYGTKNLMKLNFIQIWRCVYV